MNSGLLSVWLILHMESSLPAYVMLKGRGASLVVCNSCFAIMEELLSVHMTGQNKRVCKMDL